MIRFSWRWVENTCFRKCLLMWCKFLPACTYFKYLATWSSSTEFKGLANTRIHSVHCMWNDLCLYNAERTTASLNKVNNLVKHAAAIKKFSLYEPWKLVSRHFLLRQLSQRDSADVMSPGLRFWIYSNQLTKKLIINTKKFMNNFTFQLYHCESTIYLLLLKKTHSPVGSRQLELLCGIFVTWFNISNLLLFYLYSI